MNNFDINSKQISGPTNVMRLEGQIGSIKKVIYLFMDWQDDVSRQTECTNIYSLDINRYLAHSFNELKDTDKTYDFFMEIRPSSIIINNNETLRYKQGYLGQVMKFFSMIFAYDKEKNKVNISDFFNNVRLHYLDVRDYLKYHIIDHFDNAEYFSHQFMARSGISGQQLADIINKLIVGKNELDLTIQLLENGEYNESIKKTALIKEYTEPDAEIIIRLAHKMKNAYNHDEIKTKMNKIFQELMVEFKKLSKEVEDGINKLIEYDSKISVPSGKLMKDKVFGYRYGMNRSITRKIIVDVIDICSKLHENVIILFARLTDIYFIRRFLDKDYITNAVVYSGAGHSETYIETAGKNLLFLYICKEISIFLKNLSFREVKNKHQLSHLSDRVDIYWFP